MHLGTKPSMASNFLVMVNYQWGYVIVFTAQISQDNHKIKGLRGAKAFNFRVSKDNLGHVGYHGFDEFMQGPKTRAATHAIDGTKWVAWLITRIRTTVSNHRRAGR